MNALAARPATHRQRDRSASGAAVAAVRSEAGGTRLGDRPGRHQRQDQRADRHSVDDEDRRRVVAQPAQQERDRGVADHEGGERRSKRPLRTTAGTESRNE